MHILFLTENFPPEVNAAASRVYERACYWLKWGHQVTVVTCAPNFPQGKVYQGYKNSWYKTEDMCGIRVVRVKTFIARNDGFFLRTTDFLSFMFMAVIAGLFQKRPDIVIASSPQFFAAVGAWILAGIRRLPFVFELADLWPASISAVGAMKEGSCLRSIEKLELLLYRRSEAVVALTKSFKDDLVRRGIAASKIAVVINGVDLCRYNPQAKDEELVKHYNLEGRFVVGYIGTHGMAHSLENVVEAANILRDSKDIHFIFVGDGAAKKNLLDYALELDLQNITFIGPQPKKEIARYWSLCDTSVISLKNSAVFKTVIPSKVFEAMAMGLPVLFSGPKGEMSHIVETDDVGICVPPEDPVSMANAIVRLRSERGSGMRYAKNCSDAVLKYSRERQARYMIEVFTSVLEGRRPCLAGTY